jgi:hypothetical protein
LIQAYLEQFGPDGLQLVTKHSAVEHPEIALLRSAAPAVTFADALFDQAAPVKSPVGILALAPLPAVRGRSSRQGFEILLDASRTQATSAPSCAVPPQRVGPKPTCPSHAPTRGRQRRCAGRWERSSYSRYTSMRTLPRSRKR